MDLEKKWRYELDLTGWGQGSVAGCCEHINEPLGSIKNREFIDKLHNYWTAQEVYSLKKG
jgi:hypothetical protein